MNVNENVLSALKDVLASDSSLHKYLLNGDLNHAKLIDDLENLNQDLIKPIIQNSYFKNLGYKDNIHSIQNLVEALRSSSYITNSLTNYATKIGLASKSTNLNKFLAYNNDIILNYPYKDCLLAAKMTKDTSQEKDKSKKNKSDVAEYMLNNIIDKSELKDFQTPKLMYDVKRYDSKYPNGVPTNTFSNKDSLFIKGNNLEALYSLEKKYAGKIKLIYIDPPFNIPGDTFKYNNNFTQSTWLVFMENRLKLAKGLLSSDGSIFVHIDWHEDSYVRILLDSIFGKDSLINEIIWHYNSGGSYKNSFAKKHDTIFWYAKNKDNYHYYPNHKMVGIKRGAQKKNNMKRGKDKDGRIYYSIKSNGKEYRYYADDTVAPDDVWNVSILQQKDPERTGFNSQKPEKLLARIIGATTNVNDIVLDFFAGSATTQATALKMHRRFIGVEQMDYIDTISIPRLQNVIKGDDTSGISKEVHWHGGGSFVYAKLLPSENARVIKYISHHQKSKKDIDILNYLYDEIINGDKSDIRINLKAFTKQNKDKWKGLTNAEDKAAYLVNMLDKNELYWNYYDCNNPKTGLSKNDQEFNRSFYKGKD